MTTRRTILKGAAAAALAMPALATRALADGEFGSAELIAAAKKEGRLVYYTANFAEVEQEVINAFNKRFPEVKVEMVRAPGGQLITRVKTEAAANKLSADVVDHSDRALMSGLVDLFQDYAPPNAADYRTDVMISPKLWPRVTLVWSIAYNSALVKDPPKTWMDLTKPEYGKKQIGQVQTICGENLYQGLRDLGLVGRLRRKVPYMGRFYAQAGMLLRVVQSDTLVAEPASDSPAINNHWPFEEMPTE